jgi:DNA gyrase/topoisomerase IV subunit B
MRSVFAGEERWWPQGRREGFNAYEREIAQKLGREVRVATEGEDEDAVGKADLFVQEFPEGREASRHAKRLAEMGLDPSRFLPGGHGGFRLRTESSEAAVPCLRDALHAIRKTGQEGVNLQRYKGLGEMNAGQLWETTMAPGSRTLLRVCLEDAVRADQMFSILMGSSVEDRRVFIEKHAMEAQDLDV